MLCCKKNVQIFYRLLMVIFVDRHFGGLLYQRVFPPRWLNWGSRRLTFREKLTLRLTLRKPTMTKEINSERLAWLPNVIFWGKQTTRVRHKMADKRKLFNEYACVQEWPLCTITITTYHLTVSTVGRYLLQMNSGDSRKLKLTFYCKIFP